MKELSIKETIHVSGGMTPGICIAFIAGAYSVGWFRTAAAIATVEGLVAGGASSAVNNYLNLEKQGAFKNGFFAGAAFGAIESTFGYMLGSIFSSPKVKKSST